MPLLSRKKGSVAIFFQSRLFICVYVSIRHVLTSKKMDMIFDHNASWNRLE